MKTRSLGWVKNVALYAIGFGLLGLVLWLNWEPKYGPPAEDGGPPKQLAPGLRELLDRTPDWAALVAVGLLVAAYTPLQYARWYVLVRALGIPFAPRDAVRLGLVGTFYSTFLPGSVTGDLVKGYFIARGNPGRRAAAVSTVVADRLSGMFGLILYGAAVGGACWLAGNPQIGGSRFLQWAIGVFAGLVGLTAVGWVVVGLVSADRAERFAGRLARVPKVGPTLAEVWYTVRTYRRRPRAVLAVLGLNAVIHTGMILTFHLAVRAFRFPDPATLAEHFVIAPIGYIIQAGIPLPGGLGGAEAAFGLLYTFVGREALTGGAGRFTLRVVGEWTFGFVGYLVYLRTRSDLAGVEQEAESGGVPAPAADERPA